MARRRKKSGGRISLLVDDAQAGGSLLGAEGPAKVRFDEGRFITAAEWNEDWKSADAGEYKPEDAPLFAAKLYPYDSDDNEEETPLPQMWGCGKATRLQPTEDGDGLEPAEGSNATGYTQGCNFALFQESLVEAHGSDSWLSESASGVDGMVAMVERVERTLNIRGEGDKKVATLLVTEIIEEPGGKKPARTKKKVNKRAAKEEEEEEEEEEEGEVDVEEAAGEILDSILEDEPKGILRAKLLSRISAKLEEDDFADYASEQKAISRLLMDPTGKFVKKHDGAKVAGNKILPA